MKYKVIHWIVSKPFVKRYLKRHFDRKSIKTIFTKCPIAKIFKDNNMEELTAIFCGIDHLTIKLAKGKLIRNCTLANGDAMCDFWIIGDKVENPQ